MKINISPTSSRTRWVVDLIDQASHAWKEDYITRIFTHEDANVILSIRLPNMMMRIILLGSPKKIGIFSVRSAYRLAMNEKDSVVIGSSHNTQGDHSIWNNIWKTNVPQKVRIFTWRLATESLAVQTNRFRRIPGLTPICNVCGAEDETGFHMAHRCTFARALWHEIKEVWNLPPKHEIEYT
uniref:Reverse transcriptase zinc-binding domain-containing protein n=1 Tax=Triticum urartu TaxID=4572 RepID=A0A8R7TSY5_TRIUA